MRPSKILFSQTNKFQILSRLSPRFVDQVSIVTGASRGLGSAIVDKLASEGSKIALIDLHQESLSTRTKQLQSHGVDCLAFPIDVTNFSQVSQAVNEIEKKWGKIDVLVNAAGVTGKTNIKTHEVDLEDFSRVFKVKKMKLNKQILKIQKKKYIG